MREARTQASLLVPYVQCAGGGEREGRRRTTATPQQFRLVIARQLKGLNYLFSVVLPISFSSTQPYAWVVHVVSVSSTATVLLAPHVYLFRQMSVVKAPVKPHCFGICSAYGQIIAVMSATENEYHDINKQIAKFTASMMGMTQRLDMLNR